MLPIVCRQIILFLGLTVAIGLIGTIPTTSTTIYYFICNTIIYIYISMYRSIVLSPHLFLFHLNIRYTENKFL